MFSQYSWGDFIKFVLVFAVPYYAYVLWKYYREDIREWISNRGDIPQPATSESQEENEEELEDVNLFTVKTYADPVAPQGKAPFQQAEPGPAPKPENTMPAPSDPVLHEVELPEGIVVGDESEETFGFALVAEVVRPSERSLASVIGAAARLSIDERGALRANDSSDEEASEVAGLINEQKGFDSLLSGVSFNR